MTIHTPGLLAFEIMSFDVIDVGCRRCSSNDRNAAHPTASFAGAPVDVAMSQFGVMFACRQPPANDPWFTGQRRCRFQGTPDLDGGSV
jgi:hypothetical protein